MDTIQDTPEETFGGKIRRRLGRTSENGTARPRGKPYTQEREWRVVAILGAGLAGAAIGAGLALLVAPQSGAHTRLALTRELRRRRPWRSSPWAQLGEELRKAAGRRNFRQAGGDELED